MRRLRDVLTTSDDVRSDNLLGFLGLSGRRTSQYRRRPGVIPDPPLLVFWFWLLATASASASALAAQFLGSTLSFCGVSVSSRSRAVLYVNRSMLSRYYLDTRSARNRKVGGWEVCLWRPGGAAAPPDVGQCPGPGGPRLLRVSTTYDSYSYTRKAGSRQQE